MQSVEIGIQRVIGGELRGVGVVDDRIEADVEVHTTIVPGWHVAETGGISISFEIEPCDLIGQLQPGTVHALQCEATQKITDPRDGEGFFGRRFVAERVGLDGYTGEFWRDI